ncbi:MAG: hypothetical protein KKF44_06265 [Nanoarchaeota archaeon]|nr:hypothetical protein [Nanoarchaeota archaeon]
MKKKSQMEIFGFVIIVILVTMGLIFMITSKFKKEKSTSESYLSTDVGQNLLNSMLKTNTISKLTLADCIRDIVETDNKCTAEGIDSSRTYVKSKIESVLDKTMKEWGKNYKFSITQNMGGSQVEIKSADDGISLDPIEGNDGCLPLDEREAPGIQFLPATPTIVVKLEICK